ncbi:MAG: iron ABC transporter permease [Actinomycetes bacterium]
MRIVLLRVWTRAWGLALFVIPLAFLAVFLAYPVVSIILRGLVHQGHWNFSAFSDVANSRYYRKVLWFTIWQASASTAVTLLLALPIAALFARFEFRGKRVLWALLLVPFVLPTVVVGASFLALFGPHGASGINLQGSMWLVLLAHAFFNVAVVVRTVGTLWACLDPSMEQAARTLGASPLRTFRAVTLPLLRPAIAASASIVFLFCFTSFGILLVLGGSSSRTLEVEIYDQTARFFHLDVAAVLAIMQLVGIATALVIYSRYQRKRSVQQSLRPGRETAYRPGSFRERVFVTLALCEMGLLFGVPLVVLCWKSLSIAGFGFTSWQALFTNKRGSTIFVPPIEAVGNSLGFALAATTIALVIGGLAAWAIARRAGRGLGWFDAALLLPLGTSAVTVGFGFLIALDHGPVNLRASLWLIPIAQAIVAIPLVVWTLVPMFRSMDRQLRDAAGVLGASPWQVWRFIELPVIFRSVLVSAGFAFAISFGEFGATVFLARADYPTIPIVIYRFLGQPGALNLGQAMALSVILMAVTATIVLLVDRLRLRQLGQF